MSDVQRGMVGKTIRRNIKQTIGAWLKQFDQEKDKDLIEAIERDYIVTGGAIASMLLGDMPNDWDIYFKTQETARLVALHYVNNYREKVDKFGDGSMIEVKGNDTDGVSIVIKSAGFVGSVENEQDGYQYFEGSPQGDAEQYVDKILDKAEDKKIEKHAVAYISSNAITLNNNIQIILRFTGEPETIHKNFDFVHATCYYTKELGLVLNPDALEALLQRKLVYVGSRFPVCSLFRIRKFLSRGFTISAGEIFKIAWDVNKLDLEDRHVLEDQLMGVDQAYFSEIIEILNKDSNRKLDRTYLFELINRVFEEGIK